MAPYRFLSRELGKPVRCRDGALVGDLVDLTVLLHVSHPRVNRAAIGRGRRISHLVPCALVDRLGGDEVVLGVDGAQLQPYAAGPAPRLEAGELLLARDVVDTQVVDLAGQRLSRVSDVMLAPADVLVAPPGDTSPGGGWLEVVAVDIGLGSLLRRMGLGWAARRLAPVSVDWDDLHLVSERGNIAQLRASSIDRRTPRDLAELLGRLSTAQALEVLRTVGPERAAAALDACHPVPRERILRALGPQDSGPVTVAGRRFRRTTGWRVHRAPEPSGTEEGADGEAEGAADRSPEVPP